MDSKTTVTLHLDDLHALLGALRGELEGITDSVARQHLLKLDTKLTAAADRAAGIRGWPVVK